VKFEHAGGYKSAANLNTYNARYYEARYLAGWLAGKTSNSGVAGYVAGFPVPEVVQGINAFAIGMREANPKAQVRVLWLNTWFDPAREREAAQTLIHQGADVLTNHSGSPAVPQAAQAAFKEKGVRVIAYQSDMHAFAPDAQLAAVTHHWGGYYTQVARSVIDGRWKPAPVWAGMKDGLVQLSALDASLPKDVRTQLEAKRQAIVAGKLQPFSGRLLDNGGRERQAGGAMDDAAIATINWLAAGVVGTLP
jgi:simple sugar transport system substrate-binding protein